MKTFALFAFVTSNFHAWSIFCVQNSSFASVLRFMQSGNGMVVIFESDFA